MRAYGISVGILAAILVFSLWNSSYMTASTVRWREQLQQADETDRVNLNTADKDTLMSLPGIGEARAEAIIQYRTEHGGFTAIEEIQQISGIKGAVYSKIEDRITV